MSKEPKDVQGMPADLVGSRGLHATETEEFMYNIYIYINTDLLVTRRSQPSLKWRPTLETF